MGRETLTKSCVACPFRHFPIYLRERHRIACVFEPTAGCLGKSHGLMLESLYLQNGNPEVKKGFSRHCKHYLLSNLFTSWCLGSKQKGEILLEDCLAQCSEFGISHANET